MSLSSQAFLKSKDVCNRANVSVRYYPPTETKPSRWRVSITNRKPKFVSVHIIPHEIERESEKAQWVAEQFIRELDLEWMIKACTFHKGEYVFTV